MLSSPTISIIIFDIKICANAFKEKEPLTTLTASSFLRKILLHLNNHIKP